MSFAPFEILTSPYINIESTIFKLILSIVAGGLVGLNRERHKQPAGFRTHILICMGATLLMVLSIYIPQTYLDFKNGDPSRIAAQVVSGIGFLGAGAIIRLGTSIKGITTAASIWLISAVGLCIGAGLYAISLVAVAFALFTLIVLEQVENRWFPQMNIKILHLEFDLKNIPDGNIREILNKFRIRITDFNLSVVTDKGNHAEYTATIRMPESTDLSKLISKFNKLDSIKTVKIS